MFLGQCVPRNCGNYRINIIDDDYLKALEAPANLKAKLDGKKIKVTWKKQKSVSSYEVYRSGIGGALKKVATVKNGAYTDIKIVKGKMYRYKVVPSKMTDNTNVASKANSAKSAKIKVK